MLCWPWCSAWRLASSEFMHHHKDCRARRCHGRHKRTQSSASSVKWSMKLHNNALASRQASNWWHCFPAMAVALGKQQKFRARSTPRVGPFHPSVNSRHATFSRQWHEKVYLMAR
jgi:hypothetical protein